jgi:hypothetical protein
MGREDHGEDRRCIRKRIKISLTRLGGRSTANHTPYDFALSRFAAQSANWNRFETLCWRFLWCSHSMYISLFMFAFCSNSGILRFGSSNYSALNPKTTKRPVSSSACQDFLVGRVSTSTPVMRVLDAYAHVVEVALQPAERHGSSPWRIPKPLLETQATDPETPVLPNRA